jgi:hypothetical protein
MDAKEREQLRAAEALDVSYAEAAVFDREQMYRWLEKNAVVFTKRTDYPKLGYLIHRLNEAGIPSVQHGDSFHAPLLWVRKDCEERADAILKEKASPRARRSLDDVPDDDRRFEEYANTKPDPDLWG